MNRLLVIAMVACWGLGCFDGNDLQSTQDAPKNQPPPSGYSHPSGDGGAPAAVEQDKADFLAGKPGPGPIMIVRPEGAPTFPPSTGPVELVQLRLDTNPPMGPCPSFGAPAGSGWMQAFRFASPYSNTHPDSQPNNCKQLPPQSLYPNLGYFSYPSGANMNDLVRAFFVWASYMECVKVTFWEHDWGGASLTYQACGTTNQTATMWSGNLSADAGFSFGPTRVQIERWAW